MELKETKPCPFCNGEELDIWEDNSMETPFFTIICQSCLAKGGEGMTQNQAIILWNIRAK